MTPPPTTPAPLELGIGEPNVWHLNRRIADVAAKADTLQQTVDKHVVPVLSAIADRLGIMEADRQLAAVLPPPPPPPRIPWRLFVTALAAAIVASALSVGGVLLITGV